MGQLYGILPWSYLSIRKIFIIKNFKKESPLEIFSTLNWVDYIVIIGLVRGAWVGYKSGIFTELLRFISYFVTIFGATVVAPRIVLFIQPYWKYFSGPWAETASAILGGLAIFLGMKVASLILKKVVKTGEGFLHKFLGLLAGAARWALIFSALFMYVRYANIGIVVEDLDEGSLVAPYVTPIAPTAFEYLSRYVSESPVIP